MRWDPDQYARFADERGRPFAELVARIPSADPRRVVDLGCGSGQLTVTLTRRWPAAQIVGIDSSPEMIVEADLLGSSVRFQVGEVDEFSADGADVIVSNACLQWVPTHRELLGRWSRNLPAGGSIAFQVPGNFDAPSHELMRELADSLRWQHLLSGVLRHEDAVATPGEYADILLGAGLTVDVWETTYLHTLTGPDPVLEWLRGTGLRPILAALPAAEGAEFEAEFAALMRTAYPPTHGVTVLPYRRIFAVGHRA